jgi:dolichol kinase
VLSTSPRWDALADRLALGAALAVVATAAVATPPSRAIVAETSAAIPGMAILAFLTLCLFAIVELLDRWWRVDREWTRKLAHVGAGGIALLAPVLFRTPWPMLILTVSFAGLLLASRRIGILAPLHPSGRRGEGDLVYAAGLYAAFALANDTRGFQIAVLILALADPAAALAGRAFGRRHFRAFATTRSLEGSLAFAAVAVVIVFALQASAGLPLGVVLVRAIVLAAATTFVEAMSPAGLDNLAIPLVAILVLQLLA